MSNPKYKLPKEIIDKSFSKTWDKAKTEWEIYEIYEDLALSNQTNMYS